MCSISSAGSVIQLDLGARRVWKGEEAVNMRCKFCSVGVKICQRLQEEVRCVNLEVAAAGSRVVPRIVGDSHSCQGDPSKQTGLKKMWTGISVWNSSNRTNSTSSLF